MTKFPDYIGKDGKAYPAFNTLTVEHERELRKHVLECDTALQQCPRCWLLYCSIGHDAYTELLTSDMD